MRHGTHRPLLGSRIEIQLLVRMEHFSSAYYLTNREADRPDGEGVAFAEGVPAVYLADHQT